MNKLPEKYEWLHNTLDCGDNSCYFKNPNSGGMRTNGGCRCFIEVDSKTRIFVQRMYHTILKLIEENE